VWLKNNQPNKNLNIAPIKVSLNGGKDYLCKAIGSRTLPLSLQGRIHSVPSRDNFFAVNNTAQAIKT